MKQGIPSVLKTVMLCVLLSFLSPNQLTAQDHDLFGDGIGSLITSLELYTDGLIDGLMQEKNIPGVTLHIVNSEGTLFMKGYGMANLEENKAVYPETSLFRIGSVSKTFIWTAVMILVDRGELDLDRDINDYLKEFKISEKWDSPVTMDHLMSHRAGFEEVFSLFTIRDSDPRPLPELLALHEPQRVFPPGYRMAYSNWGASLATQVVEDISGMPFEKFLHEEILKPLRMAATFLRPSAEIPDTLQLKLADSYKFIRGRHKKDGMREAGPYSAMGMMISTAADMGRWMRFHLNGGELDGIRLLSKSTHEKMFVSPFNETALTRGATRGFFNLNRKGFESFEHGGAIGEFRSIFVLVPAVDIGIFISQNIGGSANNVVMDIIPDKIVAFVGDYRGNSIITDNEIASVDSDQKDHSPPRGSFFSNRRSFSGMLALSEALSPTKVTPDSDGGLILASRSNTTYYRPVKGQIDIYESDRGNRIAFLRDDKNRIEAFMSEFGSYERQTWWQSRGFIFLSFILALIFSITMLLAYRKRGRIKESKGAFYPTFIPLACSIGMILFTITVIAAIVHLSGEEASGLMDHPSGIVITFRIMAWIVALLAVVSIIFIPKFWKGTSWSISRKVHYSIFSLALAAAAFNLWQWNVLYGGWF